MNIKDTISSLLRERPIGRARQSGHWIASLTLVIMVMSVNVSAHAQTCTSVSEGLVGYWKFDDGTGSSTAADSSGNGNTGTLTSMDTANDWVTGKVGGGLIFNQSGDGADDRVQVSDAASIQNLTAMTACAWIYPTNLGTYQYPMIMDKSSSGADDSWNFYINDQSGDVIGLYDREKVYKEHGAVTTNTWWHVCGTSDGSNTVGGLNIYRNGVLTTSGGQSGDIGATGDDVGHTLYIGRSADTNYPFEGIIDELMLFNRALSASEIAAIYNGQNPGITAPAGTMMYNGNNASMEYCNGTDWVHAGLGSYKPSSADFDGTNDYLTSGGTLTGTTDSNKWTASFWIKSDSSVGSSVEVLDTHQGAEGDISIRPQANNGSGGADDLHIDGDNSAGTAVLTMWAEDIGLEDGQWHHIMFSVDLSNNAKRHVVVDDTVLGEGTGANQANFSTYDNAGTIDFTPVGANGFSIGASATGSAKFDGLLADFWVDFGTYIDLSNEANRRKFRSADGMPMYLGQNGSIPTGTVPDIFLSGDSLIFSSNRGSGGAFTENGALAYSSSRPGNCVSGSGPFVEEDNEATYTVISNGIHHDGAYLYAALNNDGMGAYSFNGTTIYFVAKTTGVQTNDIFSDGTYLYTTHGSSTDLRAWSFDGASFTQEGIYNTTTTTKAIWGDGRYLYMIEDDILRALTFNGSSFTSLATYTLPNSYSEPDVRGDGTYIYVANGNVDGVMAFTFDGASFTYINNVVPGAAATQLWIEGSYIYVAANNAGLFAYTFNGSSFTAAGSVDPGSFANSIWADGTYVYYGIQNGTVYAYTHDGSTFSLVDSIVLGASNTPGIIGDGTYIYTSINGDGITALSGFGACNCGMTSKGYIATEGMMTYNHRHNVMQYCNGTEWVAMGPVGGTPATNGLIAHWTLDETTGTTIADSSGNSNSGTMTGGLDAANDSVDALVGTGINFDGNNDIITVTDSVSMDLSGELTVSAWVKLDSYAPNSSHILGKASSGGGVEWSVELAEDLTVGQADTLAFILCTGAGASCAPAGSNFHRAASSGGPLDQLNRWYHVVVIYNDAANSIDFYVDGKLLSSVVGWGSPFTNSIVATNENMVMGEVNDAEELAGTLDDVRVYNRVLSPLEVQQLYYYGLSKGVGDVDNGCSSPAGIEGEMFYNADFNVLQYCNGEEWIGVGQ